MLNIVVGIIGGLLGGWLLGLFGVDVAGVGVFDGVRVTVAVRVGEGKKVAV